MGRMHGRVIRLKRASVLTIYIFIFLWLPAWVHQADGAVQHQQQLEPSLSSSLPVIDGWLSLKTTTHLAYAWKYQVSHAVQSQTAGRAGRNSSSSTTDGAEPLLQVPRKGTAVARLRAQLNRTVTSAKYGFSGSLRLTNPESVGSIVVETVTLECLWGLSVKLPCAPHQFPLQQHQQQQQQQAGGSGGTTLIIHPGETAQCHVHGLSVPAEHGTNFKQSCRVLATTQTGAVAQSGHFKLDFSSPDVQSVKGDCVRLNAQCEVTGSSFYETLGAGEQLQQGVLVCANKTLDVNVLVHDVYTGQGDIPDGCSGDAKLQCSSGLTAVQSASSTDSQASSSPAHASNKRDPASSEAQQSAEALTLALTPDDCTEPIAAPAALQPESGGDVITADEDATPLAPAEALPLLQQPKVSLHIDGTYIVQNYTWLVSSSVAPEALQVYANSTAAAQFSVTALRVPVRPSVPPKYYIEGTISVENHHRKAIDVASISAVLPWGQTAMCKPDDVVLPLKLEPSAKTSCTFRMQYDLGLKPSSMRAHATLVGNPRPLKSWPKPFNFNKADTSWSAGACARVAMEFRSDATDVSVTHAGGDAPAFDGVGTEVCEDFAKWDFTVLVTPIRKVEGMAMVVANTVVKPTTVPGADPSSTLSRSAVTLLTTEVLPWPYTDTGPLLKAMGSWRRGGEVPLVSALGGDEFLFGDRNESVTIHVNI